MLSRRRATSSPPPHNLSQSDPRWGNLEAANQALYACGANYWVCFGTLLGAVREAGLIEGDLDVDFGVLMEPSMTMLIPSFMQQDGFKMTHEWGTHENGYEQTFHRNGSKVDVFYFYDLGDELSWSAWTRKDGKPWQLEHRVAKDVVLPTHPTLEIGTMTYFPRNPVSFLTNHYGPAWRTPNPNWDWKTHPHSITPETRLD